MNAKSFNLKELPVMVMFRDTDEDGNHLVKIRSIQVIEDDLDNFMEEDIVFGLKLSACNFIKNYSEEQAKEWLKFNMEEK